MNSEDRLRAALVSGFGLGYLPVAPGTWGSAGAALVALGIWRTMPEGAALATLAGGIILTMIVGMRLCAWAENYYEGKDPGVFVLDEVAGQWCTCVLFLWAPENPLAATVAAFVAFRIFDIAKPPPARKIEHMPGGRGVMLDDIVAGLYAAALLWVVFRLRPNLF